MKTPSPVTGLRGMQDHPPAETTGFVDPPPKSYKDKAQTDSSHAPMHQEKFHTPIKPLCVSVQKSSASELNLLIKNWKLRACDTLP